jgi:hypothetical protein
MRQILLQEARDKIKVAGRGMFGSTRTRYCYKFKYRFEFMDEQLLTRSTEMFTSPPTSLNGHPSIDIVVVVVITLGTRPSRVWVHI